MEKMWAGRFSKALDSTADDFNSSLRVDCRMYREDIEGSMAHAAMLGAQGIISKEDADAIISALGDILDDLDSRKLDFSGGGEDIHMFVEAELTKRIGDAGKRLHTARSRNDQVALDIRLYLRREVGEISELLRSLMSLLCRIARANASVIMPGYTHLQRAQPVTFGHHMMAYAMMFERDLGRLADSAKRMNYSPLGCCALALDDSYSTGSSIMPQKKNPDMAELIRGKTGRVYGDLTTILVMLKGIPLAYNKDMQEDKEAIFDAADTVKMCLSVMTPMLETMKVLPDNMKNAAARGFINATDLADYLTKRGVAFRTAYKIVGQLVAKCIAEGEVLETLPLEAYREYSDVFDSDLYGEISLESCVMKRNSAGGTCPDEVIRQAEYIESVLGIN